MNDKLRVGLLSFVIVFGVVFQFAITGFICYMIYKIYVSESVVNEMMTGAILGLMTGIGLSSSISFLLSMDIKKQELEPPKENIEQ